MHAQMQREAEAVTLPPEINVAPRWHLANRIAFRFFFAYFALCIIPFPLEYLPFTGTLIEKYNNLWQAFVPWVGKHILQLSYDITVFPNGSGDTTFNYVQALCWLVMGVVAAAVWSALDRKRLSYERLYQWMRLYARFWLAAAMIGYGAIKIIPLQMPGPSLTRLLTPYGDSSPMGLLWTFIGASKGFEIFTGCAEMLGGVLLILPRTTMLGALICLADTTQIFVLNLCYDVPVKLYSFHLLVISIFLLAPDLKRLANIFILNRGVEAAIFPPLFRRRWLNVSALALQVMFGLYLIGSSFYQGYEQSKLYGDFAPKPPLHGIWSVEEFSVDGQERPPLLTDTTRWQRAIFQYAGMMTVQPMTGPNQRFSLDLDMESKRLSLGKQDDPDWKAAFTFEEPDSGLLKLEGELNGQKIYARLTRMDENKFLLKSRGFHWIQEYPFNR